MVGGSATPVDPDRVDEDIHRVRSEVKVALSLVHRSFDRRTSNVHGRT